MSEHGITNKEVGADLAGRIVLPPAHFDTPSLTTSAEPSMPLYYDWSGSTEDERVAYLKQIEATYLSILDEFFEESNSGVKTVKESNRQHLTWRRSLIIATGGLAIVNLLAAYSSQEESYYWAFLQGFLPLFAAVYAAALAILTNLESFYNFLGKAQAYRDSRELFLDAYREFELLWHVRVRPFGTRFEACTNAAEAYRALVHRDRELRRKLKELTATKKTADTASQSDHG